MASELTGPAYRRLRTPAYLRYKPPAGATVINPADDLRAIVNSAPANTVFYIKGGTYRITAPIVPKDGQKFYGEIAPDGARLTRILGSRSVAGWTPQGDGTYQATGYTGGSNSSYGSFGNPPNAYAENGKPNALIIDGVFQQRSASLPITNVNLNYHFQVSTGVITTTVNPIGSVCELTWVNYFVNDAALIGVEFHGLYISGFACQAQQGAIYLPSSTNTRIEYCEICLNHGTAFTLGSGAYVAHCYVHDQGHKDFSIRGLRPEVVGCEFSGGNRLHFASGWDAGGGKFSGTKERYPITEANAGDSPLSLWEPKIRDTWSHEAEAPALFWNDVCAQWVRYLRNAYTDAEKMGSWFEISNGCFAERNRTLRTNTLNNVEIYGIQAAAIACLSSQNYYAAYNESEASFQQGPAHSVHLQNRYYAENDNGHDPFYGVRILKTGNGTQTVFTWNAGQGNPVAFPYQEVVVALNGAKQTVGTYTLTETSCTFTTPPASGAEIVITGFQYTWNMQHAVGDPGGWGLFWNTVIPKGNPSPGLGMMININPDVPVSYDFLITGTSFPGVNRKLKMDGTTFFSADVTGLYKVDISRKTFAYIQSQGWEQQGALLPPATAAPLRDRYGWVDGYLQPLWLVEAPPKGQGKPSLTATTPSTTILKYSGEAGKFSYSIAALPRKSNAHLIVTVDGKTKASGADYTISANTLTFTTAPAAGAAVRVRRSTPLAASASPITNYQASEDLSTAAQYVSSGNVRAYPIEDMDGTPIDFKTGTLSVYLDGIKTIDGWQVKETSSDVVAGKKRLFRCVVFDTPPPRDVVVTIARETAAEQPQPSIGAAMFAKLESGINSNTYSDVTPEAYMAEIQSKGFTAVRIFQNVGENAAIADSKAAVVSAAVAVGIVPVICAFGSAGMTQTTLTNKWGELASRYQSYGSGQVVFEVFNEPAMDLAGNVDNPAAAMSWINASISVIRGISPERWILISAPGFNKPSDLEQYCTPAYLTYPENGGFVNDPYVFGAVHVYSPTGYTLSGGAGNPPTYKTLADYPTWAAGIDAEINACVNWSAAYGKRVVATEWGAQNYPKDRADFMQYSTYVAGKLRANGIGSIYYMGRPLISATYPQPEKYLHWSIYNPTNPTLFDNQPWYPGMVDLLIKSP